MKIAKRQLRRIIREELLREQPSVGGSRPWKAEMGSSTTPGGHGVDISAMMRNKPAIADWVDLLIDDLEPTLPQLQNLPEKHHDTTVNRITDSVFRALADALKSFAPHIRDDVPRRS
jgi:hypothetical protein